MGEIVGESAEKLSLVRVLSGLARTQPSSRSTPEAPAAGVDQFYFGEWTAGSELKRR